MLDQDDVESFLRAKLTEKELLHCHVPPTKAASPSGAGDDDLPDGKKRTLGAAAASSSPSLGFPEEDNVEDSFDGGAGAAGFPEEDCSAGDPFDGGAGAAAGTGGAGAAAGTGGAGALQRTETVMKRAMKASAKGKASAKTKSMKKMPEKVEETMPAIAEPTWLQEPGQADVRKWLDEVEDLYISQKEADKTGTKATKEYNKIKKSGKEAERLKEVEKTAGLLVPGGEELVLEDMMDVDMVGDEDMMKADGPPAQKPTSKNVTPSAAAAPSSSEVGAKTAPPGPMKKGPMKKAAVEEKSNEDLINEWEKVKDEAPPKMTKSQLHKTDAGEPQEPLRGFDMPFSAERFEEVAIELKVRDYFLRQEISRWPDADQLAVHMKELFRVGSGLQEVVKYICCSVNYKGGMKGGSCGR